MGCLNPKVPMIESNTVGCIVGMAGPFFPVWDKLVAARTPADLLAPPDMARCTTRWGAKDFNAYDFNIWTGQMTPESYMYAELYTPPEAHCKLLRSSLPSTHTQTTLTDFCSMFVPEAVATGHVSARDWKRWQACIVGTFDWGATEVAEDLDVPHYERRRFCPQLLEVPWMNASLRQDSYNLCYVAAAPQKSSDWSLIDDF